MTPLLEHKIVFQKRFKCPRPALFLDRDGVLLEDVHYLRRPDDVSLCLGARLLLEHAALQKFPVVIVTNQSGVSRGLFNWDSYWCVTNCMLELLGPAAQISAIYASGHGPDAPQNSWRKPSPAMLVAAAEDLNLDLSRSLMIGDRLSDLKAAAAAGLKYLAHVLTGHGQKERSSVLDWAGSVTSCGSEIPVEVELIDCLYDFPIERLLCK
jgi:D-glycero-D-manno-heptose 1,7-bisphosphate phosphatase